MLLLSQYNPDFRMVHFIWNPQVILSKLSTGPDVNSLTNMT